MNERSRSITITAEGDVLEVRHTGPFELDYLRQVLARIDAMRAIHPRMFLLMASGESTTIEARKYATEWLRTSEPLDVAVWGGGVVQRTVAELFTRGVNLIRPGQIHVSFHATRELALAWIDQRRASAAST
jgi:hypothetical protein